MDTVKVSYESEDVILRIKEWEEVGGYIRISYEEGDIVDFMNKKDWEKLKKQADHVLSCMEDNYDK